MTADYLQDRDGLDAIGLPAFAHREARHEAVIGPAGLRRGNASA
jgi:hypothetical protein